MKSFKSFINEEGRCWKGYKPVKGKKPYSDDSCEKIKEETIHVGHRNSKGDWVKTSTHSNYADAKSAMQELEKAGKKGVQHRYDNKGNIDPGMRTLAHEEVQIQEDWQKVNKADNTDGMSQKAVNAYRRENPGSKLKTAVTEKNPGGKRAARRKSFCARMSGMKRAHASAETKRDPDSPINKALRRWRC